MPPAGHWDCSLRVGNLHVYRRFALAGAVKSLTQKAEMNFVELAKSKLEFVWDGEVRISYNPILDKLSIHEKIYLTVVTKKGECIFTELLSNPDCYEAARAWWAELNADLNP